MNLGLIRPVSKEQSDTQAPERSAEDQPSLSQAESTATARNNQETATADTTLDQPRRRRSRAHNDPRTKRQTQQVELSVEPESKEAESVRTEESNL